MPEPPPTLRPTLKPTLIVISIYPCIYGLDKLGLIVRIRGLNRDSTRA